MIDTSTPSTTDLHAPLRTSVWRHRAFWGWHGAAWGGFTLATWLQRASEGEVLSSADLIDVGRWSAIGWAVSALLAAVYLRLPLRERSPLRIAVQVIGLVLVGAGAWAALHLGPLRVWAMPSRTMLRVFGVHALILSLWSGGVIGMLLLRDAERRARRAIEADRALLEARHRTLVHQINPHFLFNALNSVRALVDEAPARAREMITGLADVLRQALRADPLALARFGDELAMAEAYLAVERVRFEERLEVHVRVSDEARNASLPALLLQPLVENAITHGCGVPLRITLTASCTTTALRINVSNSGRLGASPATGASTVVRHGIGLANVRERLTLLYGEAAAFRLREHAGEVHAELELPLR